MNGELAAFHANNEKGALPINTPAKLSRFLRLSVEPWREYISFRPDDMPPKRGNPTLLEKLKADPELGYEAVPA